MTKNRSTIRTRTPWIPVKSTIVPASVGCLLRGLFCLGIIGASGCNASRYSERFGIGTIDRQKAKAAEFDPYPLNDIGPSVVGGRPPGFFNPLAEPRRNELMGKTPNYSTSPTTR